MAVPYYPGALYTPKLGLGLFGQDEVLAENFVILDSAFGGGSSINVNGTLVVSPNLNSTLPSAPAGKSNVIWQVDINGNVSAYASTASSAWATLTGDLTETQVIPFDGPTVGTPDTGISRIGVASLAIGNGTTGDFSGTIKLSGGAFPGAVFGQVNTGTDFLGLTGYTQLLIGSTTSQFAPGPTISPLEIHSTAFGSIMCWTHNSNPNVDGEIAFMRSKGTQASPLALNGDFVGAMGWNGYNGTEYVPSGGIVGQSSSLWTPSSNPMVIEFQTCLSGTSVVEVFRMGDIPITGVAQNISEINLCIASGYVFGFSISSTGGAIDSGLSRINPSIIALGNGTNGDFSGSLKLTNLVDVTGSSGTTGNILVKGASGILWDGVAWNALSNASASLTLNNTTFSTTFNQTSTAPWTWANITAATGGSAPALVASASTSGNPGGTTGAINTTGATLLVAYLGGFGGSPTISDSAGNTWHYLASNTSSGSSGQGNSCIAYAYGITTNAAHTFTTAGGFSQGIVYAFSGTLTTAAVYDSSNGTGALNSPASPLQPGSVTPTSLDIVITGLASDAGSQLLTVSSINDGFTQLQNFNSVGGQVAAYLFNVNSAINPTWTFTVGGSGAYITSAIACFKAAAANYTSPSWTLGGTYWTGSSSAADTWTIQDVIGLGNNPTSTLSISHSGTSGASLVLVPSISISGTLTDGTGAVGTSGQVLSSTVTGTKWVGASSSVNVDGSLVNNPNFKDSATVTFSVSGSDITATAIGTGVAWNAITNAAGNLTLANAGFTTTFNQTSAVAWLWANTTTATSGTTNASPLLELAANYWTGAASAADTWTIGSSLAAGTNGASTITFAHSGSTGSTILKLPTATAISWNGDTGLSRSIAGLIAVGNGTPGDTSGSLYMHSWTSLAGTIGASPSLNFTDGGSTASGYIGWYVSASRTAYMGFDTGNDVSLHITNSGAAFNVQADVLRIGSHTGSPVDTGISRLGAASLAFGNGSGSDTTASISFGKTIKYNGTATVRNGMAAEYASSDLTAQSAAITATTLLSAPQTGMYKVSWSATITTASDISSVLGGTNGFQVIYTSPTDSVAKTTVPGNSVTSSANTTGTAVGGVEVIYAKTGTNIQYTYGYTDSHTSTAMQYELHITLESL